MRDYDEVTSFLGYWGPFQRLIYVLLSLSSIPNGYVGMAMVFLADIPPHHCRLPFLNSSYGGLGYNLSIPTEEVKGEIILSHCSRYTDQNTEGCLDGWVFSKERYVSTIVTEWNLVCEDAWKTPFTITVFFLGVLTGSFLSGIISDRYGRKLIFFGTMAVQTVFSIIQAASNSWEMFSVLYFIVGMGQIANYCAAFILGCELLNKSCRISYATLGVTLSYAFGYMCLPLFAYFIRDWRMLLLTLSVPGFLYIPLWWYIPESPRWLLSQGRVEEAEAIIRAAAKKNGITPPDILTTPHHILPIYSPYTPHILTIYSPYTHHILTTPPHILTIYSPILPIILFYRITVALTYYGLSLNTPNMDGDPYLNCVIAASSEVVGYSAMWFAARYAPRRFTLPFSLIACGVLLLIIKFVPEELNALTIALAMTGKLCVTGAFAFLYLYCTELFPTVVRNMGLGVTSMASRLGSTVSPYVAYIGTYNKVLPYILMGVISIISGVLSIMLPETKDEELPELISQVKPVHWFCRKQKLVKKTSQKENIQVGIGLEKSHG
ncbi:solute carrier family 22 member 4-like [Clupea harengus]|uniref:Solute carrier family 22 member 4-like n=1 Tax=Clupea harengus TaxID=7950 RepID=A0A6P8GZC2_CLUHA|nr:solute carrier family 22 member 4-like [Clupea harengus]